MSDMTHIAPQSARQRAIAKPSGHDIARAYLDRQEPHRRRTEAAALPIETMPARQSVLRRFHHQAFAAQLFSFASQRLAFLHAKGVQKMRHCVHALRTASAEKAYRTDTMRTLLPLDLWRPRIAYQPRQAAITTADNVKATVGWRTLQMIVAPNIFLILGNLLLLMPIVYRTHGLSDDMLVQTAQLIKLGCNYLLPLLCGWALVLFSLRRPMSFLWPLIGLVSLAGNSCWLVIDARIALMGGSLRLCTNLTNSSWSWFVFYLAATLSIYLLCAKRLRRAMTGKCARLGENPTIKPLHQPRHREGRSHAKLSKQSREFLANRWHW